MENYSALASDITNETLRQLKKEKNLEARAIGGGMMSDVKMMEITLGTEKSFDICQARKLIVYCVETYLKNINSNKKIRPYLHSFPFTLKNICVGIISEYRTQMRNTPERLFSCTCCNDFIFYDINVGIDKPLKTVLKETYEEAKRIIATELLTDPKIRNKE